MFRFGEKVENKDKDLLAIVQTKARPPHYVLQVNLLGEGGRAKRPS